MTYFDAHTHVFAESQRLRRHTIATTDPTFAAIYGDPAATVATATDLIETLDRDGFTGAVTAGFAFTRQPELDAQNQALLRAAHDYRGRIVPLATINPSLSSWRTDAEHLLASGARGFGELRPGNQGWDPLGAAAHELCELAAAFGAALLWHCSEPVGHAYPGKHGGIGPAELVQLALDHPSTTMIAAHAGAGASFYLQMPEVAAAIEALYWDTAAVSLLYDEKTVSRLVDLAGPKHVLFGSDYPLLSPRRNVQRVARGLPDPAVREAVCGGNAVSLFLQNIPPEFPA
ncbi:MAG: amidohydrolase family protein [Dehalococcoidia bacterium]|nr:amidohydrolase family protein [Dehalococcoidia bacterium]MCB9487011.1 amidohydrolase family protein [Thermoflexaceae bacterium]